EPGQQGGHCHDASNAKPKNPKPRAPPSGGWGMGNRRCHGWIGFLDFGYKAVPLARNRLNEFGVPWVVSWCATNRSHGCVKGGCGFDERSLAPDVFNRLLAG